jgi:NAD(P)-dependent dehydrogenase (short-subunit alcohol dehydrogenase family)
MSAPDSQVTSRAVFEVAGCSYVVTGGARGLGRMIAEGLVHAGADVLISARNPDAAHAAAHEIDLLGPGRCRPVSADVSTPHGREAIVTAADEFVPGGVHRLVLNAGSTWGAPLREFPSHGWTTVLETNLVSVFELTVAMLPALTRAATPSDPARVVTIGSVDGLRVPSFDNFSYAASKAGVHILGRHLASRLAREHITVNTIAPARSPAT